MTPQQLRDALAATGGTLTLDAGRLGERFDEVLQTVYRGQPVAVTETTLASEPDAEVVTGRSSFLAQADLPLTARFSLDDAGDVEARLEYEVVGEVRGSSPWVPSRSLPDLPEVWNYATGRPLAPVDPKNDPIPVLPKQRPYVDSLVLSSARLIVCTAAGTDLATEAPLEPGINLVARMRPQGALGILEYVLRSGPEPLVLYGTIRIPAPTEVTRPLGRLESIWSRPDAPGVHLKADLELDLSLGKLSLDQTRLRIYTPHSAEWFASNSTFVARYGYSARLAIPSADIEIALGADLQWGLPRATLYARPQGVTLGKLTHLVDLVGGGGLSTSLPKPLRKAASALEQLALTYVSIDLAMAGAKPQVRGVAVEVGLPGLTWKVWKDDVVVRDMSCRFSVTEPFGAAAQRKVAVTVRGTVEIEGVAIAITAESADGFTLYAAMIDGSTIPLGKLMKRYAPGVPAPASLTVTDLRMMVAPGKSYSMSTTVAGRPKPWTIPVGRSKLTIGDLQLNLGYAGGKVSGTFAGSATYGKHLSLDVRYTIPGDVVIRSVIDDVKLSQLISWVASQKGALPKGFDLTFSTTSILISKRGSDYVFQVGTQIEDVGAFAFEVRKVAAGWGFAAGFALTGPLSSMPGLGALKSLEKSFALQKLVVTASSFDAASFQFPDMAQFGSPRLSGKDNIALPPQAGLTAGLCVYAQWAIDSKDKKQKMLRKFLGLPNTLGVTLQVGKDPAKQSKLFVDFTTKVSGNPLTCQFGAMMQNGQPALFLDGQLSMKISRKPVTFSVTMLLVSTGMSLSGTMQGTVQIGKVQLSNLAVMTAVSWSGVPSLGVAATIDVKTFRSSIAVMFDSTNPAKSLLAGSVSDLTLADVVTTLAKPKKLPASTKKLLGQFGIAGTQPFTIPGQTAAALDDLDLSAVAKAFKGAGETISSTPSTALLVVGKAGRSWQLTDMRNKMRHYQLVKKGKTIQVTVNAQVYCAPQATSIGKLSFDQGFYLNGALTVLGVTSSTTIEVSPGKGIAIDTFLDKKVVLYKPSFFQLSDASGKKGPRLSMSTFNQPRNPVKDFRKPHFYVSGKLRLLGTTSTAYVSITTRGAKFLVAQSQRVKLRGMGSSGSAETSWSLSGQVGAKLLKVVGSLSVDLDAKLDLGKIKAAGKKVDLGKIKLDVSVAATVDIGFERNRAYADLSGRFRFQGEGFSFKTKLSVDGNDLAKIEKVVVAEIEKLFRNALKGPEKWAKWAKKGIVEGFGDAKKAAKALKDVYRKSSKDAAKVLKGAGYAAQDVGDALQDSYKVSKKAMTKAMKDAGYAASTAEKVTKKTFKSVEKDLKKTGKKIGKLFK